MHPLLKTLPTAKRALDVPMNTTARIAGSSYFVSNDAGVLLLFKEDNLEPVVVNEGSESGWWVDGNYIPTSAYLSAVLNGQREKYKLGESTGTDDVKTESTAGRYSILVAKGRRFLFNRDERCLVEIAWGGVVALKDVRGDDPIWDLVE